MTVLDFSGKRITIVVTPFDMRAGYRMLSGSAMGIYGIDVDEGKDAVVFVSRDLKTCKIIWSDAKGTSVLTRKLRRGRFERFLVRVDSLPTQSFTTEDLNDFLDGVRIMRYPETCL